MPEAVLAPVLYVEDEEDDVVLLKIAFKRVGIDHPLRIATDGKDALDYLFVRDGHSGAAATPPPCLMLLDLNLPQLSGFEVLQQLRRSPEFADLPVIIFSSSKQASDQARARSLGADEFIVKPPDMDGLVGFARMLRERWLVRCKGANHSAAGE